ncbi:MAG: thioredoxin family protein [Fidelibacterota bacterium]
MKAEFFSAGCRLCETTLKAIQEKFPGLEMEIHLASECVDGRCCELAQNYGVRAVPSLVVDGNVILTGLPDESTLKSLTQVLTG